MNHVLSERVLALELTLLLCETKDSILIIADPYVVSADYDLTVGWQTVSANDAGIVDADAILSRRSEEVSYTTETLAVEMLLSIHFSFFLF